MPIAQLTQLDHYILRRRLEDGGYYANFESTHPSSGEKVIVSAFSPRFVQTEGFRERFAECVQRSQRARSMHLAQCHGGGFDEKADTPYIVQEAIDGRTLAEVLQGGEVLGPGWVAERIAEAAEGLKALRAQGVLHRDIRPGSLRFARDGTLKVFNLGRAGLLPPNMFRVGLDDIVGDPRYLAPEAALGKAADLRSDLYSLAATAYHLLAGKPPFQGNSFDQLARQHASSQPEPLPELDRDIPATLWDIIRDCMAKDPAKRYTDYDTFLLDWKACMRASGLTGAKGAPGAASLMAASPGRADSGGPSRLDDLTGDPFDLPSPDQLGGGAGGGFDDLAAIMPGKKIKAEEDKDPVAARLSQYEIEAKGGWFGKLLVFIVLIAVAAGGYGFYQKIKANLSKGFSEEISQEAKLWDDTKLELELLSLEVQTYLAKEGKEPSSLDDLVSAGRIKETALEDPYGGEYRLDRYAKDIVSSGPDQQENTVDDFRFNWEKERLVKNPPKPLGESSTAEERSYSSRLGGGGDDL